VWTVVVEVALVGAQHFVGVTLVVDEHSVGALGTDAPNEALRVAVGPRIQLHRMRRIGSDVSG
jgi:hypothetical protein